MVALKCPSDVYFAATKLILLDRLGENTEKIASKSQAAIICLVASFLPAALLASYIGILNSVDGFGYVEPTCYLSPFWGFLDDKRIQDSDTAALIRSEMGANASTMVDLWDVRYSVCSISLSAKSELSVAQWLVVTVSALVAAGIADADCLSRAKSVRLAMSVQASTPWIWISRELVMLTNHSRMAATMVILSMAPVMVIADGKHASIALNFAALLILLDAGNMLLTPILGERGADKLCEKPLLFTERDETALRRGSSIFYVGVLLMCGTIPLAPVIGLDTYNYYPACIIGGAMGLRDYLLARNCKEACYLLVTHLVAVGVGYPTFITLGFLLF